MDTRPIWDGPIGNSGWKVEILPIAEHMTRGTLYIKDVNGDTRYQTEVPVTRSNPLGGTPTDMAQWNRTVTTWFHNNT